VDSIDWGLYGRRPLLLWASWERVRWVKRRELYVPMIDRLFHGVNEIAAATRLLLRVDLWISSWPNKTSMINIVRWPSYIEFTQFSIRQRSKVVTAFDSNGSTPSAIKSLRGRRFESCRCRFFCFFGLALLGVAVSVPLIEWRTTIRSGFVLLDRYIPPHRIILWKGVDQRLSFAQTGEKRTCTHSVLVPPRYYQHSSMAITNRHGTEQHPP
jgi:hypothetical protein